jgi:hypothetical protein
MITASDVQNDGAPSLPAQDDEPMVWRLHQDIEHSEASRARRHPNGVNVGMCRDFP